MQKNRELVVQWLNASLSQEQWRKWAQIFSNDICSQNWSSGFFPDIPVSHMKLPLKADESTFIPHSYKQTEHYFIMKNIVCLTISIFLYFLNIYLSHSPGSKVPRYILNTPEFHFKCMVIDLKYFNISR